MLGLDTLVTREDLTVAAVGELKVGDRLVTTAGSTSAVGAVVDAVMPLYRVLPWKSRPFTCTGDMAIKTAWTVDILDHVLQLGRYTAMLYRDMNTDQFDPLAVAQGPVR